MLANDQRDSLDPSRRRRVKQMRELIFFHMELIGDLPPYMCDFLVATYPIRERGEGASA